VEQRLKIKFRNEDPIALDDIAAKDWKIRTIVRGDRFKAGVDFGETAVPVVHSPVVKMLIAYAVQKGLFIYSWDVESAFYLNLMDRPGVIVQLTAGYDLTPQTSGPSTCRPCTLSLPRPFLESPRALSCTTTSCLQRY
jgi:hypothetical protein